MNAVYAIAPSLTLRTAPVAKEFLNTLYKVLAEFDGLTILHTSSALRSREIEASDAVIVFNRADQAYEQPVQQFLEKATGAGAKVLPVACTKAERHPPMLIEHAQSFDIEDQLRQRALTEAQVATVATVFARQVLAVTRPTLTVEPMHLFLSHRRFDGEEIAAKFHRSLLTASQKGFRDLVDVKIGEDAQEVIEERLRESDAVIFFDTPKAGESPWVAKELQMALSLQLPIVWVRLGPDAGRVPLPVTPSASPHVAFPNLDPASDEVSSEDVDRIVHKAFSIHHRDYVDRMFDDLHRLKQIAGQHGITFEVLDPRRMIYRLALPRPAGRYKERPLTHLLQFFGRTPTKADTGQFTACAKEAGYETHPKYGVHYDSAILLAATPSRFNARFNECGVHTDCVGDYVNEIARTTQRKAPARKRRLVISGAFADCEPDFYQNMTNAVHAFVEASLVRGLSVSFGAHPTFQFLIFDLARRLRPSDYRDAVKMFVSKYFVKDSFLDEAAKSATVVATDEVNNERAASLTEMRRAMLQDKEAGGLVVIGGKMARGGHVPGVDEEIALARAAGLPVYIIGSVGGRSGELLSGMSLTERVELNGLPEAVQSD